MDTIYIGFSQPKRFKLGSAAIKLWQRSNYSHVYIRFASMVVHSAHGSVHVQTFERFKKENQIIQEFKIETPRLYHIQMYCYSKVGQKYGYIELFKIFIYDILNTVKIRLNFTDSSGYICSEFIGWVLTEQLNLKFDKPHYLLTPKDIYLKLVEHKYSTTI